MVSETTEKRLPILQGLFHEGTGPGDESHLIGSRCSDCGRTFFPKRFMCNVCLKEGTMEDTPLSTRGRIDTYSVVQVAPMGFKAPYIQAFVDLPEGPRVFCIITGCEPTIDAIAEGQEVELVIEKIREDEKGNELIGYKFRPI
jgi:scaffold protein (connect acetoacetyl-CoA thiolase and HMG-CoA synthase)